MEGFGLLSKLTVIAYLPLKFFHQFIIFSFLFFKTEQHLTASTKYSISLPNYTLVTPECACTGVSVCVLRAIKELGHYEFC